MHANVEIIKSDLDTKLNQMQAQGIAEVQAKLILGLPMMQEALISQLQTTLTGLEATTVENYQTCAVATDTV